MPNHRIFISLGSNIDAHKHTQQGLNALHQAFGDLHLSSLYESEAVGFDGDNFLNMVIGADTHASIEDVCVALKKIEKDNGRVHGDKKFCSRTLDLDLLLYDEQVCNTPIVLPRQEIIHNAFVLLPLSEIAPAMQHPGSNETYQQMWQQYHKKQKLWAVELEWSNP